MLSVFWLFCFFKLINLLREYLTYLRVNRKPSGRLTASLHLYSVALVRHRALNKLNNLLSLHLEDKQLSTGMQCRESEVGWEILQKKVDFPIPAHVTLSGSSSLAWKAQPCGMCSRTFGTERKRERCMDVMSESWIAVTWLEVFKIAQVRDNKTKGN